MQSNRVLAGTDNWETVDKEHPTAKDHRPVPQTAF